MRDRVGVEETERISPVPRGRPRGRHRRPRPRKVLLAVAGGALAVAVLSLVRLSPDSRVTGAGTAEAEPGQVPPAARAAGPPSPGADATPFTAPRATSTPHDPRIPYAPGTAPGTNPGTGRTDRDPHAVTAPTSATAPDPAPARTRTPSTRAPAHRGPVPDRHATPEPGPTHGPTDHRTPAPPQPTASPAPDPGLCLPVVKVCVGLAIGSG